MGKETIGFIGLGIMGTPMSTHLMNAGHEIVVYDIVPEAVEGMVDPKLDIRVKRIGDRMCIEISDNGVGIPKELQEKIFVPFFTTKPEGSGIGLSLSRQIVMNHGGQLSLESIPGRGSTFRVFLPVE